MALFKDSVIHWQKKLERGASDDKILETLSKLQRVPMTLSLLQETGIGKTVNSLKKGNGDIRNKAKEIVSSWKQVVSGSSSQSSPSPTKTKPSSSSGRHSSSKSTEAYEPKPVTNKYTASYSNGHNSDEASYEPSSHKLSKYSVDYASQSASQYDPSNYSQGNESDSDSQYDPHSSKDDYRGYLKSVRTPLSTTIHKLSDEDQEDSMDETDEHYKAEVNGSRAKSVEKPSSSNSAKLHSDRQEKHKSPKSIEKDKKKATKKTVAEEFDNSIASFEACLGLNDVVPKKSKPKPKHTSSVKASHSATTSSASTSSGSTKINHMPKLASSNISSKRSSSNEPQHEKRRSSKHKSSKRPKEEEYVPEELKAPMLVPLRDVDILSTLPEIQPDYKPFRHKMPDSPPHKKKSMSLEEAIQYTSSRKEKTAVYAGRKNQYLSEVPTLYDSCVRVLIENIDELGYTGGIPYDMLRPVLRICTPAQLYNFEDYNTNVLEDTDELWLVHCQRDFKGRQPDKGETWRDLYLKLHDEREAKLKSITANISASMKKAVPVRQTKLAYVDSVAKPPREVRRKQVKHGTSLPSDFPMKPLGKAPRPIMGAMNSALAAASSSAGSAGSSQPKKPKVAPLMQKTLTMMKQRFRR